MTSGRQPTTEPMPAWNGETYYGRPQLKPAPFNSVVVGGYIFLAGLSGASALIGALAEAQAKQASPQRAKECRPLVRRSRYLSLLAPTIGSALLVYDLHTPQRFYNMFRVAKKTSPMSIGTWILTVFSGFAGVSAGAQMVSDLRPKWRWPRRVASAAQIPAALAGAGLSTYTAALVSATSTPIWAAAPRATAVRFASSSVAAAAAALAIGERSVKARGAMSKLLLTALTAELGATLAADAAYRRAGIADGRSGAWGKVEKVGATGIGVMLPIGLMIASRLNIERPGSLRAAAGIVALVGSAALRVSFLGVGMESAPRPNVSMRFAQRDNLPKG